MKGKVYFIITQSSDQIIRFEEFKRVIQSKKNNQELMDVMGDMLDAIADKSNLEFLSIKFPYHFTSSLINWQMEYDIAKKILLKEIGNSKLTYVFELTNYFFYFLLLPPHFRSTFFLLHGLRVDRDEKIWLDLIDKLKSNRYSIFKGGQELLSTFLCDKRKMAGDDIKAINKQLEFYGVNLLEQNISDEARSIIFQISNR